MRERPILFSAPMVRALLAGCKTQTRRIVRPPSGYEWLDMAAGTMINAGGHKKHLSDLPQKYGQPGERLWVRETHRPVWGQTPGYLIGVDYKADPQEKWERMRDHLGRPAWVPSIHMRREYSRILLEVANVRVERLQDINDDDCLAEGIHAIHHEGDGTYFHHERTYADPGNWCHPDLAYKALWESINGAGSWEANPWVRVVEFKRVQP